MNKIIQNLKGYEAVKSLVESEISDYSYFKQGEVKWNDNYGDYDETDEQEHYQIDITTRDKHKTLSFNYNIKEETIEIELGEDSWNEVCDYDWRVKYFWMALLEWS